MTDERQHRELTELFEEFIATLQVNRLRRAVTATNPIFEEDYANLLDSYKNRLVALAPDGYVFREPAQLSPELVEKVDFGTLYMITDDMSAQEFAKYQKKCNPSKRFAYHATHEVPAIGMFAADKNRFCLLAVYLNNHWQKMVQEVSVDDVIYPLVEGWREVVKFTSSARDRGHPGYPERSGQYVTILRPLSSTECDTTEIGPMYRIQFADGVETDVYADEVT